MAFVATCESNEHNLQRRIWNIWVQQFIYLQSLKTQRFCLNFFFLKKGYLNYYLGLHEFVRAQKFQQHWIFRASGHNFDSHVQHAKNTFLLLVLKPKADCQHSFCILRVLTHADQKNSLKTLKTHIFLWKFVVEKTF